MNFSKFNVFSKLKELKNKSSGKNVPWLTKLFGFLFSKKEKRPKSMKKSYNVFSYFDINQLRQISLEDVYKYKNGATIFFTIILAYFTASFLSLYVSYSLLEIKDKADRVEIADKSQPVMTDKAREEYQIITKRNIFNSKATPETIMKAQTKFMDPQSPATASTLPLNLIGTIVLSNTQKSLAVVLNKDSNKADAFRINDIIKDKGGKEQARVIKIERKRLTFENRITGNAEYIEIKDAELIFGKKSSSKSSGKMEAGIKAVEEGKYVVDKNVIDNALTNINDLITKARAVPHYENGKVVGFKIFQIEPGSLFSKIGLQENDILKSVNGTAIDSPGKGLELYNQLKSGSSSIQIEVDRNGNSQTLAYDIR